MNWSLPVIHIGAELTEMADTRRGTMICGDQFRVSEEQLGQHDRLLVIGQPSLPGTHNTIMPPGCL